MTADERYAKVGPKSWTITLRRRSDLALDTIDESVAAEGPLVDPKPTEQEEALVSRGVTAATAAELVLAHPADFIKKKLEAFDWLLEKKDKRVSKSPAGYLAESVRKDYAEPRGFESKAERERKLADQEAQRQRVLEAKRQADEAQRKKEDDEDRRLTAYWESLTEKEQEQLMAEALKQSDYSFAIKGYRRNQADPKLFGAII